MITKRALIIGLATYANPKNNLNGVENDVSAMVKLLGKFGVEDVEVIRDSNATSDNIKRGLQNLVSNAQTGDVRVFYYSGHGALLPSGFSGSDDADGRDEALVPYEGSVSSLILDNWISTFLKEIVPKDIFFWSIYDSCHSGDMFKNIVVAGLPPPFPENAKEKLLKLPDLVFDLPPQRMQPRSLIKTKALILDGELTNSIHFGAAEPEKTALVLDITGKRRSAFTWALEQVAIPGMTVREFELAVTAKQLTVTDHHHPQIAANLVHQDRPLFA
jgi:Caspase domain